MDLNKLSLGDRIVAGLGILEFLLLLIVPWHSQEVDYGLGVTDTVTKKATEGDGPLLAWPAVIALILLVALVAIVLIRKLADGVNLPDLPIGWNLAIFIAAVAVPVLLLIKLLAYTEAISFWAYILIAIGIGIAYGGYLISREPETTPAHGATPPTPF